MSAEAAAHAASRDSASDGHRFYEETLWLPHDIDYCGVTTIFSNPCSISKSTHRIYTVFQR